jgi:hypothetical protein
MARPMAWSDDSVAELVYRWRVTPGFAQDFFARIKMIVQTEYPATALGARLCQPIFGPESDVWELWMHLPGSALDELAGDAGSLLWQLAEVSGQFGHRGSPPPVVLIELSSPLYRVWSLRDASPGTGP